MLWYENIPTARWSFEDREGTKAHLDLHFAVNVDRAALWNAMKAESCFEAMSDCTLYQHSMILGAALTGAPEATAINLASGVIMLFSDAETYTTLVVPGLRTDLLESVGCFGQQRINMLHPDMIAFVAALDGIPLVTPRGDPIIGVTSGGVAHSWFDLSQRSG